MTHLSRLIDLRTDEILAPMLDRIIRHVNPPPSMAQIQLLYRRAQSVRHTSDLFHKQNSVNHEGSFEYWLGRRIALAEKRITSGSDHKARESAEACKRLYTAISDQLFGKRAEALHHASDKLLAEAGIQQPSQAQRCEVQMLLFRSWVDCYFARLRHHAAAKPASHQDRSSDQYRAQHPRRTP